MIPRSLAKLRQEARELGAVVNNDTAAATEGFMDTLTRFQTALAGLGNSIASRLMPVVEPMIAVMTRWVVANRALIASGVERAVTAIGAAIAAIDFPVIVEKVQAFLVTIAAVVDAVGGWEVALIGLAVVLNGTLIGSVVTDEVRHDGPPDSITVSARAAAFGARIKDQREDSWHWQTLGAILATIAARNDLVAAVDPALAGQVVPHLDQTTESDAHLLTRLGRDHGAVATVKDGRLVFVPLGSGRAASGAGLPTARIDRSECSRHGFAVAAVHARWRDLDAGVTRHAIAGDPGGGSVKTLKRDFPSQTEAQAAATAEPRRQHRAARAITLTCLGRPDIIANQPLTLAGWRPEIDGVDWVTGDINHSLDASGGFTTTVKASER